jgi:PAS domain S-box-containing protein
MGISELERELNDLAAYIEDLWRFSPTPLAYLNPQGVVLGVDQALINLFGISQEEIVGQLLCDLFPRGQEILKIQAETLAAGSVAAREVVLRDKAGAGKTVSISTMVRKDAEENIIGYFVSLIDISEQKKAEVQLKDQLAELEVFNKVVVGREIKMSDLEREVDGLLKELGRNEKYE